MYHFVEFDNSKQALLAFDPGLRLHLEIIFFLLRFLRQTNCCNYERPHPPVGFEKHSKTQKQRRVQNFY